MNNITFVERVRLVESYFISCSRVVSRPTGTTPRHRDRPGPFSGVCSWESSELPNLADRVQILAPLLVADVAERRGPCLVSRFMPVRVRPSASTERLACDGRHATPRRSKTRFDSWQGH